MPSYLFQENFIPTPIYHSPLELYSQSLQIKDAKFRAGLQNIRSKYDSVLSADLTNGQNQVKVREGVEDAMNRLSKVAVSDVSLPENQAQVNKLFDNVIDDDIMFDMAWTRNYRNQVYKAETLQKNKPELVTPQNLHPLYRAQDAYSKGDPGLRPGLVQFNPYFDYNKKYNDELDKVKADVDLVFKNENLVITLPDGKSLKVGLMTQQQVKQVKDLKIRTMLWDRISSDTQAMGQMKLDYDYNKDYGLYSAAGALDGIKTDLTTYSGLAKDTRALIDSGKLDEDQKAEHQKNLDYYNLKVTDLNRLNKSIREGGDPTDYFSYNEFIKGYVDSKAQQYSYKEQELLHAYPGWDKYLEGTFSNLKDAAKKKEEPEIKPATPYSDIINRLMENPQGVQVDDDQLSGFLEMHKDTDGRFYYNLSFDNKDPMNRVIIKPATQELSQEQMKTMGGAQVLTDLKRDLNKLDLTYTESYDRFGEKRTESYTADKILEDYYLNKTRDVDAQSAAAHGKGKSGFNHTDQVKEIIAKYAPSLKQAGYDISDPTTFKKLEGELSDPTMKSAVSFGEDLSNINFKGRFEFRPDQNDLALGKSGHAYGKGRFMIPASEFKKISVDKDDLIKAGVLSEEEFSTYKGEDGKSKGERMYGLSVYLPVQGTPEDINERMLRNSNAFEGLGKDTPEYKQKARDQVSQYTADLTASQAYNYNVKFVKSGDNLVPNPQNADERAEVENMNKIARDITQATGEDYNTTVKNIYNVLGVNPSAYKRYIGMTNFRNNAALKLQGNQKEIAETIESVGSNLGASARDIQIAKLVAMTESGARNLPYGDRDSLGVFQQRANWGSVAERTDVQTSTKLFFDALLKIKDRQNKTPWQIAQEVQRSAWTGESNTDNKGDIRIGGNYQDIWNKYFNQ